jgi:hypothetical protein
MKQVVRFSAACIAVTVVVLLAVWALGGFAELGVDASGALALSLGIIFTVALGVGLMALIFYGERDP